MKKSKNSLFIKIAMLVFLFLYLERLYTADYAKNVPVETLNSYLEQNTSITDMPVRSKSDLQRYFNIMNADKDSFLFYKDLSPMSVNEAMVIKLRDKDETDNALENAEKHLESQENIFSGYGTTQMGYLNKALVGSKGNYVYYFCGPDSVSQCEAFLSQI